MSANILRTSNPNSGRNDTTASVKPIPSATFDKIDRNAPDSPTPISTSAEILSGDNFFPPVHNVNQDIANIYQNDTLIPTDRHTTDAKRSMNTPAVVATAVFTSLFVCFFTKPKDTTMQAVYQTAVQT